LKKVRKAIFQSLTCPGVIGKTEIAADDMLEKAHRGLFS
jgi:hypothetical protein